MRAEVVLDVDPSTFSTAQQKGFDRRSGRFFTKKKVAATKRVVALLASPHRRDVLAAIPPGSGIRLQIAYLFAWPKATPKRDLVDGKPMTVGADCDNIHKAVQDALGDAGWWGDDREVSTIVVSKRRTTGRPRVLIAVEPDGIVEGWAEFREVTP